jgi:hypothetical protein
MPAIVSDAWLRLIGYCLTHRFLTLTIQLREGSPLLLEHGCSAYEGTPSAEWASCIVKCQAWPEERVSLTIQNGQPAMIRRYPTFPFEGQAEVTVKP